MITELLQRNYVTPDGITSTDLPHWANNYLLAYLEWLKDHDVAKNYYNLVHDDSGFGDITLNDFTSKQDNVVSVHQIEAFKRYDDGDDVEGWDFLLFVWRNEAEKIMFIMRWSY